METKNKKQKIPAATEEHAVILDYLSLGYVNSDMSKFKGKALVKPVTPTSVPVKEEAPTLPATGEKSTAASVAAGAAMVTSALALFGISTYKRKH